MVLQMERDKYFSSLLYIICEGLNSFFFSKTQKNICPIVRKTPCLSLLLKNGHLRMTLELKPTMGRFFLLYAIIAPKWNTMISC